MSTHAPIHLVQRTDGIWQVEREDEVVPVSVHGFRDEAIDAALIVARREHRGLAFHNWPRPPARWVDVAARALLHRRGTSTSRHRRAG